jgi:hypothetical protein
VARRSVTLVFRNDEPGMPVFEGILINVADMTADEIIAARLCPARVIRRPNGSYMQMPIDLDDHQVFAGMIDERPDGTFVAVAQSDVDRPKAHDAFMDEYRADFAARRAAKWERLHKRQWEEECALAEREGAGS